MADLIERFRSLDQIDSPDLWGDAARRSPTVPPPPPRRSRERFVAAVVALTLAIAAIAFAFRALGGSPAGQPASGSSPSASDTQGLVAFTLDSASGQGTLTYGDSTRTYRATGFCADPDCRSATYDPIPADSIKIPTELTFGFEGDMEPVDFRVTSNSHQPSDFERTVDLARDPSLHLPTGFFLFDITARASDGRYTHLYFGVVSADEAVGARAPDALVTSIHLAEPSSLASIAYGEGSVWVSLREGPSFNQGSIVRLDGQTVDQIAKIPVDTVPGWEVGGGGLVVANGSVWVAGRTYDRETQKDAGEIIRIDPATNSVVRTIPTAAPVADIAVDGNDLYALLEAQGGAVALERIDIRSGYAVGALPLEGFQGRSVVFVNGTLYALVRSGDPKYEDVLYQVDPTTMQRTASYVTDSYGALAAADGRVWWAVGSSLLWLDPAAGRGKVEGPNNTGDAVAAGDGAVWVLGDGRGPERYDIDTGQVGPTVEMHHSPIAMAVAPGALWTANDDGTVTLIKLG